MKIVDLTGKRFGYLKVIKQDGVIRSHKTWLCECDCGNKKVVIGSKLLQGQVKSCGCMHTFMDIIRQIQGYTIYGVL